MVLPYGRAIISLHSASYMCEYIDDAEIPTVGYYLRVLFPYIISWGCWRGRGGLGLPPREPRRWSTWLCLIPSLYICVFRDKRWDSPSRAPGVPIVVVGQGLINIQTSQHHFGSTNTTIVAKCAKLIISAHDFYNLCWTKYLTDYGRALRPASHQPPPSSTLRRCWMTVG